MCTSQLGWSFVLDDGRFGQREDDQTSLGDVCSVNEDKAAVVACKGLATHAKSKEFNSFVVFNPKWFLTV